MYFCVCFTSMSPPRIWASWHLGLWLALLLFVSLRPSAPNHWMNMSCLHPPVPWLCFHFSHVGWPAAPRPFTSLYPSTCYFLSLPRQPSRLCFSGESFLKIPQDLAQLLHEGSHDPSHPLKTEGLPCPLACLCNRAGHIAVIGMFSEYF